MKIPKTDICWKYEIWYDREPIEHDEQLIDRIKKPLKKDKAIIQRLRELVAQINQLNDENEINTCGFKILDFRDQLADVRIGVFRNMRLLNQQPELVGTELLVLNSYSLSDYSTAREMIEKDSRLYCCFTNCYGDGLVLILHLMDPIGKRDYNMYVDHYANEFEKQYPIKFNRNLEPGCFIISFDPDIHINEDHDRLRSDLFYGEEYYSEVQNG